MATPFGLLSSSGFTNKLLRLQYPHPESVCSVSVGDYRRDQGLRLEPDKVQLCVAASPQYSFREIKIRWNLQSDCCVRAPLASRRRRWTVY